MDINWNLTNFDILDILDYLKHDWQNIDNCPAPF